MNLRINLLLLITFTLSHCNYLKKPTPKEIIQKDISLYLKGKYKEEFEIKEIKWLCNEGNNCPDAHSVISFPKNNPNIVFNSTIRYDTEKPYEVERDDYKLAMLNYKALQDLNFHLDKFQIQYSSKSYCLGPSVQLETTEVKNIDFRTLVSNSSYEWSISNNLALFYDAKANKDNVIELVKSILRYYEPLKLKDLHLEIKFYDPKILNKISTMDIKRISQTFPIPYSDDLEYIWNFNFETRNLQNLDSTLINIEDFIQENNIVERRSK